MMNETHPWGGNVPGAGRRGHGCRPVQVQAAAESVGRNRLGFIPYGLNPEFIEPWGRGISPPLPRWRAKSLERL